MKQRIDVLKGFNYYVIQKLKYHDENLNHDFAITKIFHIKFHLNIFFKNFSSFRETCSAKTSVG